MKRIISNLMLVAAAAMAFFACQKQEISAPEEVKVEGLNFSAEKPEFADASKTEWTGSGIHWSKEDAIRVAYTCNGVWQNADGTATADEDNGKKTAKLYVSTTLAEASATAKFAVPGNFKGTASGVYEFYAIYPSGAAVKGADFPFAPSVTVDIPAEQTPLANSFDSAADLMAAKSVEIFEGLPTERISLLWTRMVAHGHLTLKNLQVEEDEKLQTITLTADENADMVGQYYLYLDTYNVEKASGNNAANSLTVKADNLTIAEGGNVTFWTCFLPCTWKSLDVVVETDKATYTREIDLSTNQKTFAQNARNTLAINMATAERVAKTALSLPFVRDFSDRSGSSEITELDGFSSIDGKVYNADEAIRLASGNDDGSITTQPLDLSQNFHVIVTACGWDSGELKMTVSAGEQTENITLTTYGASQKPGTWKDYVINFDPVGPTASVQFSAVKDYRYFIQKIQILEGHADLPSTLTVTAPEQMPAEGGEGSFTYTLSNPKDGIELTVSEEADWITDVVVAEGTVTYTVEANNTADPREADITLTYGDLRETVTVSQKGQTTTGTTEWVAKSFTDLKDGDEVVIVATKESTSWAMANDKGTGSAPTGVTGITYSNNKLTDAPAEKIIWYIGVDGNNRIFYKDSGKDTWLYCTGTNNGVRVGTNAAKTFTFDSGYLKHVGTGRYVGVYTTNPDWRCYTSTTTNIADQTFLFFVKSGNEEPKPAITVSSEASVNVEATGGTGTVSYTLTNAVADAKVSAQANQTWVTIGTITSTSVPFTVSENTGEQRTATITLSYDGAESKTVNITQAAAQSGGGETQAYTVTYTVASKTSVTVSGDAPEGSNATFAATYSTPNQITSGNAQTYTLTGYSGCVIKSVVLSMHANSGKGAGTLSLKAGSQTLASISTATSFDQWYNNTSFGTDWRDVDVTLTNDSYVIGANESVVLQLQGTTNSIYCQSVTVTYEKSINGGGGGETPDPTPDPTTYTYTFTSKAWADATSSWTSGKDGGQMQSDRGVQVSTTYTGANATCKTSMSNIQKVVFVYSTNSSNGAGSIKVSIGNQEKTLFVTKTGGTSDRNLEFDFSDSPLSGQLKFTVTCTTNSIYIKSVSITAD